MKNDSIEGFTCYSVALKDFLMSRNIRYIATGLNHKNLNRFWVFVKTDSVNQALREWTLVRNKVYNPSN